MKRLAHHPLGGLLANGLRLLGGQGALIGLGFTQTWIATRVLGPSLFGAWALVLSFATLVSLFLSFRTSEALTSFWVESRRREDLKAQELVFSSALYAELVTKGLTLAVIMVFTPIVLRISGFTGDTVPAVLCSGVGRLLSFVDPLWFSVLRDERKITELAVQPVAVAGVQLASTVLAVFILGASVNTFAYAYLVAQCASAANKLWALRQSAGVKALMGRGPFPGPLTILRERRNAMPFWSMMSAGYFSSCLSSLVKEADGVLIGMLAGTKEIGFYRLAKSLVGLLQTAAQTLSTLLFQRFAELHADRDPVALAQFIRKIAPPLILCSLLGGVLLLVGIHPLLFWIFGARYLPAVVPFRILLVGVCVSSALVWVSPLLTMLRRMREVVLLNVATFVIFVTALLIALPIFHGLAPAVAVSAAWSLGHLLGLWQAWRVTLGAMA